MATWTSIADARLEPDKPARSIDALALRDNPIAIAENAANAPKVDQYYLLITTSTTWTVPKTGQYWIDLIGGGGGGGDGTGGGGGGSGYVASKVLTLTQGDTYPIVIGIAGNGGASAASGFGGAATTGFGLSAAGGGGGGGSPSGGGGGTGHSSGRNGSGGIGGKGGSAPILVPDINATDGAGASGSGGFGYGAGGGGSGAGGGGGGGAQGAVIIRGI